MPISSRNDDKIDNKIDNNMNYYGKPEKDQKQKQTKISENYQDLLRVIIEHKEFVEIQEKIKNNDIQEVLVTETNPEEDALEFIASFNDSMNTMAMNAFQIEKMLGICMQENKIIEEWMGQLSKLTEETEQRLMSDINSAKNEF